METAYLLIGYNGIVSGYHLHQGTSLDSFPSDYPHLFLQETPLSTPVCIVVQNTGLGEWLVRTLAARQGAVMGPQILMPEQALRRFAGGYAVARRMVSPDGTDPGIDRSTLSRGVGRGLLFMDSMKLTVFKALEEVISGGDVLYTPLRDYAGGQESRLWQLADSLAGVFYHYGMNCLPLVDAWDAGRAYEGIPASLKASEAWQRGLWERIFNSRAPYTHLSRVLSETMSGKDGYDGPEVKIVLYGSMFLGETGLKFFRHLARSLEVHHFIFTPSKAFTLYPESDAPAGDLPYQAVSPRLPFLMNNGRLSADFAGLLPTLRPDSYHWHPGHEAGTSLLQEIRSALLEDRSPDFVRDDGSLVIHDVVGPRRQVEVLKDRILEALRDDEELAPTEIGVLAPDIAAYAPNIEAIFPGSGDTDELTYNLSDLPVRNEAPFPSAFAALMSLVGSRFGRNTLVSLFENPCFAPCAGSPDLAADWRDMAESLNVRWGTGSDHRSSMGAADPLTGSWDHAFRRLLAAYCFDEGDKPDILPGMLGGDSRAESAGRLMRTIGALETDLRTLDGKRLPLKDWTLLWEKIIDTWLRPRMDSEEDESDRLRIKCAVRDLVALDEDVVSLADFDDRELPWSAFSALLEEMISPTGGRKGRYLARGVTCASLKPMRAIPFRRIYVLGLEEGAWPGREYLTGFDLRDSVEKAIDLSRESVDRFAFLETLFAASEHISFFYSGRDAERGESTSPASPLAEMCEILGSGWRSLLRVHPLVPYDPAALGQDKRIITSSREALDLARSLEAGLPPAPRIDGPAAPSVDEESVDWKDLAAFLRDPIAFYYRDSLGLRPEYRQEEDDEDDILEPAFLDWWQWQYRAVTDDPALLADPGAMASSFMAMLKLNGAVADTPFGELSGVRRREDAASLARQLARLETEGLVPGGAFSLQLDPAAEEVEGGTGPGELLRVPAPVLTLEDGRTVAVTGRIPGLRLLEKDSRIWTAMDFVSGDRLKIRHLFRSWVAALVAGNVADDAGPVEFRVFRLGGHDFPARRYRYSGNSDERGGEQRLIADPAGTLEALMMIRDEGRKAPMVLHHEIADSLAAAEKKNGALDADEVSGTARTRWNALVSSTDGYSYLRDCGFRHRFLKVPDFDSPVFHRTWQDLFRRGGLV